MKLRRLRVHALKSIRALDHVFGDSGLTLLGRNGSGKTTVLEAISLLGHVGVMALAPLRKAPDAGAFAATPGASLLNALLEGDDADAITGASPSLRAACDTLARHFGGRGDALGKPESSRVAESFAASPGENPVERAFESLRRSEGAAISPALILLDVVTEAGAPVSLLVRLAPGADLTVVLSHEFSDRETEAALTLYFDAESEPARDLILRSLASRPVSLGRKGTSRAIPPCRALADGAGVVSYVNTDLNDFGRGNDLRESPKNITDDFAAVVTRLCIDTERIRAPLNEILSRILSPDDRRGWSIEELAVEEGRTRLVITDHFGKPQLRNHLSAGENEIFFAFLVLLGLPTREGIVILDEPAFHASPETAPAFFDELYALCERNGTQLFVGSHNAWCLPETADQPTATLEIPRTPEAAHRLLDPLDSRQRFQALHRDAFDRIERSVKGVERATRDRARLLAHAVREDLAPLTRRLFLDRIGLYGGLAAAGIVSLHVATTATLPVMLLGTGAAAAAAGVLVWLVFSNFARLHRERQRLVQQQFESHYAAADVRSKERTLFLRELEDSSRWQLRAYLGEERLPLLEFLPNRDGGVWPALSFTIGHFLIAATIVWWYTGSWALGGQVALVEPVVNGFWHYANAHIWRRRRAERHPT